MDSPNGKGSGRVVNLANQTKEEQSLINVTADGLIEKDKKRRPEKEESFFKQVFKGGLKLLSYDSSSLH